MTELGQGTKALLDAARGGDEPSTADKARVRAALAAAIGAPPASVPQAKPAVPAATAPAASASAIAKVVGALGVVTLVGGAALFARPAPTVVLRPMPSAIGATSSALRDLPPPVAADPPPEVAAPIAVAPPPVAPSGPASSHRTAPPAAAPPSLEAEARALAEAQRALAAGDASRAKALLEEQGTAFRGGSLGPERAAAEVFALCSLGRRDEARAKASTFLREHAGSPLAPRVASACEGPSLSGTEAPASGHPSSERAGTETHP